MSASSIAAWRDPKTRRNMLEGFAEDQRHRASGPELRVKAFLDANFTDVIHQYVPDEDGSPGIYDFYIVDTDIIMEVDGRYWHNKEAGQKRDREKEEFAQEHDYGFIRITEDQAKSHKYMRSLLEELECI